MDSTKLRKTFASRIRKLREGKLNQGEFADSVGVSRGAMSYYEQEARTPDIGVLRAICEKYKVSADYLIGLIADQNHSVSDVCRETGLTADAAKNLRTLAVLANTDFKNPVHLLETFDEEYPEAMQLAAFTSVPDVLSILLGNEEGLSLLTLLGAIILGAEVSAGDDGQAMPVIKLKSASKNFEVAVPIDNLTAALWVNIQEYANTLKEKAQEAATEE